MTNRITAKQYRARARVCKAVARELQLGRPINFENPSDEIKEAAQWLRGLMKKEERKMEGLAKLRQTQETEQAEFEERRLKQSQMANGTCDGLTD